MYISGDLNSQWMHNANCEKLMFSLQRNPSCVWWFTPVISALENGGKRIVSSRPAWTTFWYSVSKIPPFHVKTESTFSSLHSFWVDNLRRNLRSRPLLGYSYYLTIATKMLHFLHSFSSFPHIIFQFHFPILCSIKWLNKVLRGLASRKCTKYMLNILKLSIMHIFISRVAYFLIVSAPNLHSSFLHRRMICLSNSIRIGAFSFYCSCSGLKFSTDSLLRLHNNNNSNNLWKQHSNKKGFAGSPETAWCRIGQFHADARIMKPIDPCQVHQKGRQSSWEERDPRVCNIRHTKSSYHVDQPSMLALSNMKLVHHINHQKECWDSQAPLRLESYLKLKAFMRGPDVPWWIIPNKRAQSISSWYYEILDGMLGGNESESL